MKRTRSQDEIEEAGAKRARHEEEPMAMPGREGEGGDPPSSPLVDLTRLLSPELRDAQQLFQPVDNALNAHPNDARIRFDDSEFIDAKTGKRDKRHDYYLEGYEGRPLSVTTFIGKFFAHFDGREAASHCARSGRGVYQATRTPEDVLAMWDKWRDDASAVHLGIEHYLQHRPIPENALPPPRGLLKVLKKYPQPTRTEHMVADFTRGLVGSADVEFDGWYCEDGTFIKGHVLGDWKTFDRGKMAKKAGRKGTHPLTMAMDAGKASTVGLQLNIYRHILETHYGCKIAKMVVFCFPRHDNGDMEEVDIPRMDVAPFLDLLPWDPADPRHVMPRKPPPPSPLYLVPLLPPADPRGEGPTTTVRISPQLAGLPDVVWTGRKYTKNDYCLADSPWRNQFEKFRVPTAETWPPYEDWLRQQRPLLERLTRELYGKKLACWCDGRNNIVCHANVLARYANALGSGALTLPPPQ